MPRKRSDWEKFFRALQIAGRTVGGIAQLKEAQAQQEAEEQEAKVKADFFAERLKNPLNIQEVGGTPMVAPSGKPLGAAVLSGMYDKYQRKSDAQLIDTYRMLDETPPEWLKARAKPIEQVRAPHVPPKKKAKKEPTETEKDIAAHLAVERGTAIPEQKIRARLRPFPGQKTTPELTPSKINSVWSLASKKFTNEAWQSKPTIEVVEIVNREGKKHYPKIWIDQTAPYEVMIKDRQWPLSNIKETVYLTPATIKELQKAERDRDKDLITQEQFLRALRAAIASEQ